VNEHIVLRAMGDCKCAGTIANRWWFWRYSNCRRFCQSQTSSYCACPC